MSVVPRPARKAHWLSRRITPLCWTCNDSRLSTTRAIILPAMESSEIPRWMSQQALFPFRLNMCTILASLKSWGTASWFHVRSHSLVRRWRQLFTAMPVDLISEGIESALGDLPEDICWIVHLTSATNGGWLIYELPRPTLGSHQAQYCQIPLAESARIGNAQPSAARWGIHKSLCHHSSHKVWIEKEYSRLWMNSVTSAVFCILMLALMTILVTDWNIWLLRLLADSLSVYCTFMGSAGQARSLSTGAVVLTAVCCIAANHGQWTLYRRHTLKLDQFHPRCSRKIANT